MSVRKTSESIESNLGWRNCVNHSDRVASHQLMGNSNHSDVFYCEKCSIMLASQGFSVMKLSPTSRYKDGSLTKSERPKKTNFKTSGRKAEINGFLGNLE